MKLFSFRGGIHLPVHKEETTSRPIASMPLTSRYVMQLTQGMGEQRVLVKPGQKVAKGEVIAAPATALGVALHAPTSGVVVAMENHASTQHSGIATPCLLIDADGEDRWLNHEPFNLSSMSAEDKRNVLRDYGVVGLGGASFPTHVKLKTEQPVDTLILNGAECEPYITCDDMLMRERSEGILRGAVHMGEMLGVKRIVLGIEDNKPQALAAMKKANENLKAGVEVTSVLTIYPAGGAPQLIYTLTGIHVPRNWLSYQFGVQCFNVGTAWQVHRVLDHGEPCISRIVTLAGAVKKGQNFDALIGTPISWLLAQVEPVHSVNRYLIGGPMMGFALSDVGAPVTKEVNCVLALHEENTAPAQTEMPCIRCGRCAKACPHELQPFQLYWFAKGRDFGKTQKYDLFDCIECGCCSYVCPSSIPLVNYFRFAKAEIWARERQKAEANAARSRFEKREERLMRLKEEREAMLAQHTAASREKLAKQGAVGQEEEGEKRNLIAQTMARAEKTKMESLPSEEGVSALTALDASKQQAIAEALERTALQKANASLIDTGNLTAEQRMQIVQVEARRARLAKSIARFRQMEEVGNEEWS